MSKKVNWIFTQTSAYTLFGTKWYSREYTAYINGKRVGFIINNDQHPKRFVVCTLGRHKLSYCKFLENAKLNLERKVIV